MTALENFNALAKDGILDDLAFFCREAGSKKGSPNAEYQEMGDITRYCAHSLFPVLNGVFQVNPRCTHISPEIVQEQIEYFVERKIPHVWWLVNEEQKEQMGPLLESKGYMSGGTYLGYAKSVDTIDVEKLPKMPESTPVRVQEVETDEEFINFCDAFANIFGIDARAADIYKGLMKDYGRGKLYRHVYATVDNKVVGVMSAMLRNGWCGVWNGGVLPEARGQGMGRALCLEIFKVGQEEDVSAYSGILMAEAMAKGLCHKFGAEKVSEIYPYLYGIQSEEFEPK